MLEIKNLKAAVDNKEILTGVSLSINPGEIHAIMGPNGSGKSSLSLTLAGSPNYKISKGQIKFMSENITEMDADERARKGIFLAMQSPVIIEGLSFSSLLKNSITAAREAKGLKALTHAEFFKELDKYLPVLNIKKEDLKRSVNFGFSGGEKKKFEILQMLMLKPKFVILDEIDSGLDIDALKKIGEAVDLFFKEGKEQNEERAIMIITHYPRILEHVKPNFVHIYSKGKIVKTGSSKLAGKVEKEGYKEYGEISHE
jgi:Fe-S cluster assembly ATP-binding protein